MVMQARYCWILTVLLAACSSSTASSGHPDAADAGSKADAGGAGATAGVAATVVITGPTGQEAFTTLADHVDLSGVTFGPIDKVTWSTDHGESGTAQGTGSWSATVPVAPGQTTVTLHATGPDADATETLVVQRNVSVQWLEVPTIEPVGVFINTSASLHVQVALAPQAQIQPGSVKVVRVMADGSTQDLGPLYDDGDLKHGDDVQGDHVYNAQVAISEATPGLLQLRAVANAPDGTPEPSPVATVSAVTPLTEPQIVAMQARHESASSAFDQALAAGKSREEAIAAVEAELEQDPDVLVVDHEPGNTTGVLVVWKHGVLGTLGFPEPDTLAGPDGGAGGGSDSEDHVGNHDVLLLSPFLASLQGRDGNTGLQALFDAATCPKNKATAFADAGVTFDIMRDIGNYGVVSLSTHGSSFEERKLVKVITDVTDGSVVIKVKLLGLRTDKPNQRDVIFLTSGGDKATLIRPDVQLAMLTGSVALTRKGLAVTARFFRTTAKPMKHNLVHLGCCRGLKNGDLPKALLGRGSAAVTGFTGTVNAPFARDKWRGLLNCLLKGEGLEPDVKATMAKCFHSAADPFHAGTEFRLVPADSKLSLRGADFRNGGFEDGTLGWTATGDARIVSGFGSYVPQEGGKMLLASTGLGFTSASGSFTQSFCMPADVKTLSFDWHFLSAEFKTYCNSKFQDGFVVKLGTAAAPEAIFSRNIDALCGSVTLAQASIPQDGDPDGAFSTGWLKATNLDVSQFAGQSDLELTFSVTDVGDSVYDTAVLIDNVVFGK